MNDAVCDSSSPALTGGQSAHTEEIEPHRGGMDATVMRGRIVGAEFYPEDAESDEVVLRIAVPSWHAVAGWKVAVVQEPYFDSMLPSWRDVRGILAEAEQSGSSGGEG